MLAPLHAKQQGESIFKKVRPTSIFTIILSVISWEAPYKQGWTKEEHILFLNGLQKYGKVNNSEAYKKNSGLTCV